MSGKPALIPQRDGVSVVIPLHAADGSEISPPADSNNSFDKIMRKLGAA